MWVCDSVRSGHVLWLIGPMEKRLTERTDMRRVPTLPYTLPLAFLGVIPLLVMGVASAAPRYPVDNPPETQLIVSYESASNTLTLSTPTAETPDAGTLGVDGTSNDESVSVVGPNGQVNHGQIVKRTHELAEVRQRECVTRTVAQSDLGKGDQQVRPHEQSTSTDATEPVDRSVLEGECSDSGLSSKLVPARASDHRVDHPDTPQGKSEDAPGKKK